MTVGKNLRVDAVGMGKSSPACTDKTDACDAKNRRVELEIVPPAAK